MNKTQIRQKIKFSALQNMQGNWIKVFILFLISVLLVNFIIGFLPISIPENSDVTALNERLAKLYEIEPTPENEEYIIKESFDISKASFMLFFPNGITKRVIASFAVTVLLFLIVMCPFNIGMKKFYLRAASSEKASVFEVFTAFRSLGDIFSAIVLHFIVFFASAFWFIVFSIIPIAMYILAAVLGSFLIAFAALLLFPIACFVAALWVSRYRFAYYIFACGGKGAFSSFFECIKLLRGRNIECMLLRLSYLGWDIVCSILPFITVIYESLSGVVYSRYLFYFIGSHIAEQQNETEN